MCRGSEVGRRAGRKHGVLLVMNRIWPALGETSHFSSSRVFDETGVALPKEIRPLLGHLGVFNFSRNLPLPSRILQFYTNAVSLCCLLTTYRQLFPLLSQDINEMPAHPCSQRKGGC